MSELDKRIKEVFDLISYLKQYIGQGIVINLHEENPSNHSEGFTGVDGTTYVFQTNNHYANKPGLDQVIAERFYKKRFDDEALKHEGLSELHFIDIELEYLNGIDLKIKKDYRYVLTPLIELFEANRLKAIDEYQSRFISNRMLNVRESLTSRSVESEAIRKERYQQYIDVSFDYSPTLEDFKEELEIEKRNSTEEQYLKFLRECKKKYGNSAYYHIQYSDKMGDTHLAVKSLCSNEIVRILGGNTNPIHGRASVPVCALFLHYAIQSGEMKSGESGKTEAFFSDKAKEFGHTSGENLRKTYNNLLDKTNGAKAKRNVKNLEIVISILKIYAYTKALNLAEIDLKNALLK